MHHSVEEFGSELQPEPFVNLKCLDDSQIQVPVVGRSENVATHAILPGIRNAELLVGAYDKVAWQTRRWVEKNGPGKSLAW